MLTHGLDDRVERHSRHPLLFLAAPLQVNERTVIGAGQRCIQAVIWLDICVGCIRRVLVHPFHVSSTCY